MYKPIYPGTYYFNNFTFTSMGNSGNRGPTSDQTYADAPWPSSYFSIKNGQQNWTVPANGTYQITAAGAYGATPGRVVTGQVTLYEGQVLTMLVGQEPTPLTANVLDNVTVGGGGGTFIVTNGVPLIVASGGDGSGPTSSPGSFLPSGSGTGGSGAGYYGNGSGTNPFFQFLVPYSYVNGGYGNNYEYGQVTIAEQGGFGGGQSPIGLVTTISQITGDGTTAVCVTAVPHGYPFNYVVTITGTTYYDGVKQIQVLDPSTFVAFASSNTQTVTTGTVSGLATGSSGGGGYTGSPGDGTQGASCYADPSVQNFTDLGATSNASGYVTISLVNPIPITPSPTWNQTWTYQPSVSPYPTTWSACAYGNGTYVAVSNNGTYPVTYSPDGLNWYTQTYGSSVQPWVSVTFGNGLFVAVSNTGGTMVSPDGINWNNFTPPVLYSWSSITYGNGVYVVVGGTLYSTPGYTIMYSSDASNWKTTQIAVSAYLLSVAYGNGVFVAVGVGRKVYRSSDGIHWSVGFINEQTVIYAPLYTSITYGNGLFLVVDFAADLGNTAILSSPDGITWTSATTAAYTRYDTIAYGNGLFVAVAIYDNAAITSTNGTTWTNPVSINLTNTNITNLVYYPATMNFVIISNDGSSSASVSTTTNGINWNSYSVPFSSWTSIACSNNLLVAVSCTAPYVMTCTTLPTWVARTAPAGAWTSVTYANGQFIATSSDGITAIMKSQDGINWAPTNASYSSITAGSGLFVATSSRGASYSTDGINWSQSSVVQPDTWSAVTYGQGTFNITNAPFIFNGQNIDDELGHAIALSADGSILAAAAPNANDGNGNVYVYTNGQLSYTVQGQDAYANFGQSVALSADGSILAVGASYANNDNGNVYVYTNGQLSYTVQGQDADARFGQSVALSADGSILAVGSGDYNRVHVYTNGVSTYAVSETVSTSFGWRVALSADGSVLAVSAFALYGGVGAAYVYKNGTPLVFSPLQTGSSDDEFGRGLAMSADGSVLAVGAPYASGQVGAVYLYINGVLSETVNSIDPLATDTYFGLSVALRADGSYLAVGAPIANNNTGYVALYTSSNYTSLFVAVANKGTTANVMYSSDGVNWSNTTTETTSNSWTAVTYGNGTFVATASSNVMYSTDGQNWIQGPPLSLNSNCITYGNGYFVAPSSNTSAPRVALSTDITSSWQYSQVPSASYKGITYGPQGFVGVSPTPFTLEVSPQFWINPAQVSTSNKLNSSYWNGLAYGNGTFVAVGNGLIQGTQDQGNTWNSFTVSNVSCITYSQNLGTFVTISNTFTNGTYTSQDGLNWTQNTNLPSAVPSATTSITYGNGLFVSVLNGVSNVLYSQDGVYWNATTSGTSTQPWTCVAYGNGQFIATASNGFEMTSSDGMNWTTITPSQIPSSNWSSVTYGNGLFVAVSNVGSFNVMTSPDGITWTAQANTYSSQWSSVTYGNGTFVAVASLGDTVVSTSQDGIHWYSNTAPSRVWNAVTFGNGVFVAVGGPVPSSFGNFIMTSPDGANWTEVFAQEDYNKGLGSVTYGNGLFVAFANYEGYPVCLVSQDNGVTWTTPSSIVGAQQSGSTSVVYGNGIFVRVASVTAPYVITSFDGLNWTPVIAPASSWTSVTYGNGVFVAVANTSPYVMTSTNGVDWSAESSPNGSWTSVTYANNTFVAVSGNEVMISADGTSWAIVPVKPSTITYGNGIFVGITPIGVILHSNDGITWLVSSIQASTLWSSISFGNGIFMAVSNNGTYPVAYSQDGINWSTQTTGFQTTNWGSIAFGQNTFMALNAEGASTMITQFGETF
jgi:hypothetical protein